MDGGVKTPPLHRGRNIFESYKTGHLTPFFFAPQKYTQIHQVKLAVPGRFGKPTKYSEVTN
jgi:hypothetical protein